MNPEDANSKYIKSFARMQITVDENERARIEEEEALEEQKKRQEEIKMLLDNQLDEFKYDDTASSINSSVHADYEDINMRNSLCKVRASPSSTLANEFTTENEPNFINISSAQMLNELRIQELKQLQNDFDQYKSECDNKIKNINRKYILLEAENNGIKESLQEAMNLNAEKTEIIKNTKDELEQIQNNIQILGDQNKELVSKNKALKTNSMMLEAKIKALEATPLMPATAQANLDLLHERYMADIHHLTNVIDGLKQKESVAEKAKNDLELQMLETKEMEKTITKKQTAINDLFSRIKQYQFEIKNLKTEIEVLKNNNSSNNNCDKIHLEINIDPNDDNSKVLMTLNHNLRTELRRLKDELLLEKQNMCSLRNQYLKTMSDLEVSQNRVSIFQNLNENNNETHNSTQVEYINSLKTIIQQLNAQICSYKDEIEAIHRANEKQECDGTNDLKEDELINEKMTEESRKSAENVEANLELTISNFPKMDLENSEEALKKKRVDNFNDLLKIIYGMPKHSLEDLEAKDSGWYSDSELLTLKHEGPKISVRCYNKQKRKVNKLLENIFNMEKVLQTQNKELNSAYMKNENLRHERKNVVKLVTYFQNTILECEQHIFDLNRALVNKEKLLPKMLTDIQKFKKNHTIITKSQKDLLDKMKLKLTNGPQKILINFDNTLKNINEINDRFETEIQSLEEDFGNTQLQKKKSI